jgi:glucan 1,3-beta-glucosidase
MWGWTADHDLDGGNKQTISVRGGALIEATKGTWLVGTAMEHNTLYQYNFNNAANVFTAMQQSETPYWQGPGNDMAPQPWTDDLQPSDPRFNNCLPGDAQCGMAWFETISNSDNLFLYGGCVWTFFNNDLTCVNHDCQQNAIEISNSSNTYLYGTNVRSITNIVISDGEIVALEAANLGGWGGVVAAYLFNS